MEKYEVPGSINELFSNKEDSYLIIDHSVELDNVEAMRLFLETVGIESNYIFSDEGTQVDLVHPDWDFGLTIDSYGGGDFFTHRFDVSFTEVD